MDELNIGIVGLGWPGERHAEAVLAVQGARLYACADSHEQRREKFRQIFPVEKTFDEFELMLTDPAVDAVILCLPNFLHFPATLAALQAGKHVLCEKPPTMNAAEMKVLHEESGNRNLTYFFGRQSRFSQSMLAAKQLIDSGRTGEIYYAKAIWVRSRGTPGGVGGWFTDKSRSGGGALIDIGVHALDAVWYLMGTPRPISVSAKVFQNFPDLPQTPVFDVEDAAYGFIRFANGAVVHLEVSWAANLTDDIPDSGDWTDREMANSIVYGRKASIRLNPLALFEEHNSKVVAVNIEVEGKVNPFVVQMENFVKAVKGSAKPLNDAQQAVYLMEMIDAIYASSEIEHEVPIT